MWSERQKLWIQEQCISALVVTDQDGSNELRLMTASGRGGSIPEAVLPHLEIYGAQVVSKDRERKHAEVRGIDWADRTNRRVVAIGAGLDVCYDCECATRRCCIGWG
ncbi:hypothetical protein [Fodinicola feengrottensis]|uniref:Uncharacterized protein n=1 Tax=Fodinicola feengrottensis TaxID=435914 RepID=A0ABN2G9M5_9ACTN|nr:hypothetical protein [Fodinicola feengrottensis]